MRGFATLAINAFECKIIWIFSFTRQVGGWGTDPVEGLRVVGGWGTDPIEGYITLQHSVDTIVVEVGFTISVLIPCWGL